MGDKVKSFAVMMVGAVGSIVGAIGAITTVGLIEAGVNAARKQPTETTNEEES